MPTTVRELERPSNSLDAKNAGQFVRTFEVYAPTGAAITADGVPAYNELHPEFANAKVDAKSAVYFSPESSLVTVTYTTNRGARFSEPPPKPEDLPFPVWQIGSQSEVVEIPYAVLRSVSFPTLEGGEVNKSVYVVETFKSEESRLSVRVQCVITSLSSAELTTMMSEVNKIHLLPGFPEGYQFRLLGANANLRPGDTTRWDVEYQWLGDTGTPPITDATGAGVFYPEPTAPNPAVCRRPHRLFVTIPVDPEVPPIFADVERFVFNPVGWQALPGVTL